MSKRTARPLQAIGTQQQRPRHRHHPFNLSRFILEDPSPRLESWKTGDAPNLERVSYRHLQKCFAKPTRPLRIVEPSLGLALHIYVIRLPRVFHVKFVDRSASCGP